ncbi:sodium:proton antiporter [Archangium violaceum]|uniref:sodium:proton antiporter n=1 Tax=Archangium violaceum TaxID=83451 RepID=UPI00193BBA26|nr:sodium:proton antiporter [Archangium violaceum]QRK04757.1 sodium:proton antiporter [Archangium violaceum]
MRKVFIYSILLLGGLVASQALPALGPGVYEPLAHVIRLLTMVGLAFIMIHVGQEFDLDKSNLRQYGWDYVVAATAATFPWIFVTLYFVFVLAPPEFWGRFDYWKEALLQGRFAAPTSAGVLFSMLAAAGLGATWVFRKARILAIFDDLDTILLMVPLTVLLVGFRWQLAGVIALIVLLLWGGWKYLHRWRIPYSWPWVLGYSVLLALVSELIYLGTGYMDPDAAVHFEVLLPAFILGCMIAKPEHGLHEQDGLEGEQPGPDARNEQRVATVISGCFMVLVGLSMPALGGAGASREAAQSVSAVAGGSPGWGLIALHVLAVTLLSNLGKMFPALCYRDKASPRERVALAVGLFPRGEVGAGVLVVSLGYGISGTAMTVALLSLALNLLLTGIFILAVKRLLAAPHPEAISISTKAPRPPRGQTHRPPRNIPASEGGH